MTDQARLIPNRQAGKTLQRDEQIRTALDGGLQVVEMYQGGRFYGVHLGPRGELLREQLAREIGEGPATS